ncbi:hypothetical protein K3G39_20200 [Pontibacter sp. HSC-14F20]|uniref:hypothetical protein n=1 Tax=Pontibacter sp. HSC-14F20 TaxID=2864136 RepID=UPI001C733FFC|nr:hypothetical protein [Pontibacter sp. HSC-14F20]MBX0335560.1 hypothetical protein [Pontibacter sp. HSC-14F20]
MLNPALFYNNIQLLLKNTEDILHYDPYYNCRVNISNSTLKYLPLGPYIDFWKEVPVNNAGKVLLTIDVFRIGHSRASNPARDELMLKSGFRQKHPLPGIPYFVLSNIMRRYMQQFQDQTYLIGVSIEQVIQELQERKPLEQRLSYGYFKLREKLDSAVKNITGTNCFTSRVVPAFQEGLEQYNPKRYYNSPVFYRIQQQTDLSFKLIIELQVPTKYPVGRGIKLITSGGAVAIADTMRAAYEILELTLNKGGYKKLSSQVTLQEIGITGVFEKPLQLTANALLAPDDVEELSVLLNKLRAVLDSYSLWVSLQGVQDLMDESPCRFSY